MSLLMRWLIIAGVAALITTAAALAPLGFRRMDAFRVKRVEVTGSRFMTPEAALAATGISDSSSVFDDPEAWIERLRAERLIADARVEQRLPGTVRIELVEAQPIALVRTPELRPVDARGRLLPIALAGELLDAPIVAERAKFGADSMADSMTVRLIGGLLDVRALDAPLADRISEVGWAGGGGLRFVLQQPDNAELLLPEHPEGRVLHEVALALEHLRMDRRDTTDRNTAFDRLARIDARYADELFVSLRSRATN
jgi:POTRA domain, FtsQ-type